MITTHTNTIILVDMDGVLCDFNQSLLRNAHEKLGAPLLTNKDCTTFYTEEMFGSQFRDGVAKLSDESDFFANLAPIEGAVDALNEMEALGFTVFICTAPKKFYHNPHCAEEKHRWVMKHFGKQWTERIILTRDKTLVHGAVLIDDKPEITGSVVPTWKHVYFDQPYNSTYDKPRITTWGSWEAELLPLLEE